MVRDHCLVHVQRALRFAGRAAREVQQRGVFRIGGADLEVRVGSVHQASEVAHVRQLRDRGGFADDQHVWATVLFDEVVALGYPRSYQTFTRQLRGRGLRPHCEPCSASNGRAHTDIEHPPGAEIQWDWLELNDTPWGDKPWVLVGALSCSGRFRVWFSDADDQAHLVVGIDEILRRLGELAELLLRKVGEERRLREGVDFRVVGEEHARNLHLSRRLAYPRRQSAGRRGAMAVPALPFVPELGHGARLAGRDEDRVVTEALRPSRLRGDGALERARAAVG